MLPDTAHAARPKRVGGLHLAIVTETYPPEINGVANTMRHLVEGLARRGHRLQLIRPRQQAEQRPLDSDRIAVHLVPGLPIPGYQGLRFGLPVYWRLRRLWSRSTPDLVYIATQGPLGHAALSAARAHRIPTVTGFHTQFQQYSQHYGLGFFTQQIAETLRHFHNRSDMTLVPTAELQQELSNEGFRHVHVFGRGVDVNLFSPAWRDPGLRREWGCDDDTLAILYVGRIAPEKNLALARQTYRAIRAVRRTARFVLVGDGPLLEQIRRDNPEYICPGARVGEELSRYYASGDLFLFPSLTETYGNVVPEAMASGLPVVAFGYAAAGSLIDPWSNGVTLKGADRDAFVAAGCELARDLERLRNLGERARQTAEGISWDRVIRGVEERLYQVIHRSGGTEACRATMATTSE
ncbi:MAG: glycosyltransferase family 1 protein [Thiocapsa sp.]|jgi:glycosyltransferase involved in cell wall biosynthesis|nr:glycosyltransferase family 1 protein [Thiocapsa sp.]MCG6896633.1 glycosyltransferase family 1 protein [Thiocapsa sp.]MCG6985995.1 glycosyltransferase family 1 protein [Thiocapsa sp.]